MAAQNLLGRMKAVSWRKKQYEVYNWDPTAITPENNNTAQSSFTISLFIRSETEGYGKELEGWE